MIEIPDLDSIYIPKPEQDGTTDQETEQMNNAYARSTASSNSLPGNNARSIDQEPDMQEINSSLDGFEIDSLNFKIIQDYHLAVTRILALNMLTMVTAKPQPWQLVCRFYRIILMNTRLHSNYKNHL